MKPTKIKKSSILKFAESTDGELLQLPLQMLMQTIFLGGNKGSGKTSSMKRLFEAAHGAGAQCGVIAPLGRWWSLRIAKNGKGRGLKDVFVFGGKHGDVPIDAASGRAVARTAAQKRIHFVLDVELMRKNDRIQFVADFLEELWQLKKEEDASHPMVLFIDEAQNVAPQKTRGSEGERMKEAAADLCREGRNHGVGMVLSAQRSANVDKDLLALVEMLIVMRTIHHLDRKVYQSWVDEKGDTDEDEGAWLRKLRRLQKGEAYIYAPELNVFERVKVLMPDTYDATATAVMGERVAKVGKLSKLDVKKLGEELTKVVEEASANDPAKLRGEVQRLTQLVKQHELGHFLGKHKKVINETHEELYKKWSKVHLEPVKRKLEQLRGTRIKILERYLKKMVAYNVDLAELVKKLDNQRDRLAQAQQVVVGQMDLLKLALVGKLEIDLETRHVVPAAHPGYQTLPVGPAPSAHPIIPPGNYTVRSTAVKLEKNGAVKRTLKQQIEVAGNGKLNGSKLEVQTTGFRLIGKMTDILVVLLQGPLSRDDLATMVGMVPGSGGFNNYIGALKTAALVQNDSGPYELTPEGRNQVANLAPLSRGLEDVIARHGGRIMGKMKLMVAALKSQPLQRDYIADAAGMTRGSGGFNNYIGALKTRGIVVSDGGVYRINPVFQ